MTDPNITLEYKNILMFADALGTDADIVLTGLTGWDDISLERKTYPRPWAHGSYVTPAFQPSRQVIAEGLVYKPEKAARLYETIVANFAPADNGERELNELVVDDGRGAKTMIVVANRFEITDNARLGDGIFRFRIEFVSGDGLKYGAPLYGYAYPAQFSGGLVYPLYKPTDQYLSYGEISQNNIVTITNPGTSVVYPFFTVTGEAPEGFRISEIATGQTWQYDLPVNSEQVLTIDNRSAQAYLDGINVTEKMTNRAAMQIGKGAEQRYRFDVTAPSATIIPFLTIEIRPTYW